MRIFLSSVFRELEDWRDLVTEALEKFGAGAPNRMEIFGARPDTPRDVCLAEVARADVVVVLVGESYGSLEPQSHLSYTHLEVREAIRLARPLLVFFATGLTENPADRERLAAFKGELSARCTPDYSRRETIAADVVTAVARYVRDHGEGGVYRTFQESETYFHDLMNKAAAFSHGWPLVGRATELDALLAFLGGNQRVAVLVGQGGVGKSRLLLEVARRQSDVKLRFLAENGGIDSETVKELPQGPLCVVVDDCHRRSDLTAVRQACAAYNPHCKFMFSARPVGRESVLSDLRSLAPSDVFVLPDVLPLDMRTEALELAKAVLGNELERYGTTLARAADGNPLIITVGGRCLANGDIPVALLERGEDFRRAALNRLLEFVPLDQGTAQEMQDLLELIAAIGPIRVDEADVRERLSSFLRSPVDLLARRLDSLERAGYLLRRGTLVRVTPDVLSDHLLFRASVTTAGVASGYIQRVFGAFAGGALSNTLRNAAELEWRCNASGMRVDVLGETWSETMRQMPSVPYGKRIAVLHALEPTAIFVPERVLELAQWMLDNPSAPRSTHADLLGHMPEQHDVLRALPKLLREVAQHPAHAHAAAALLWRLGQLDTRTLPQHPDHAVRVLQDLASYRKYQTLEVQQAVLHTIMESIERNEMTYWSPSEVAGSALKREVENSFYEGHNFHLEAYALDSSRPEVAAVRERAIAILNRVALGTTTKFAAHAVATLGDLLRPPYGSFGRTISQEEDSRWKAEARVAIEILKEIGRSTPSAFIRHAARHELIAWRARGWEDLTQGIQDALSDVTTSDDDALVRILCGPEGLPRIGRWADGRAQLAVQASDIALKLWADEGSLEAVLAKVRTVGQDVALADQVSADGLGMLVEALARTRPEEADELISALAASEDAWLRRGLIGGLTHFKTSEDYESLVRHITGFADHVRTDVRQDVAWSCQWLLYQVPLSAGVIGIYERFVCDGEESVRTAIMHAVTAIAEAHPREAVDIILRTDFRGSGRTADYACMHFLKHGGIDPAILSVSEVRVLVESLGSVDVIGDHCWHSWEFLRTIGIQEPAAVAAMLLSRVDVAAAETRDKEFKPFPFIHEGGNGGAWEFPDPVKDPKFGAVLETVQARLFRRVWQYEFWIPMLLKVLCPSVEEALASVEKWAASGDPERIARAPAILKSYPYTVVYTAHETIAKLLQAAKRAGSNCLDRVTGALWRIAVAGDYSSVGGQLPARLAADRDRAALLADTYRDLAEVHALYALLRRHADQETERRRTELEEGE